MVTFPAVNPHGDAEAFVLEVRGDGCVSSPAKEPT